jgi:uncharacterized protein
VSFFLTLFVSSLCVVDAEKMLAVCRKKLFERRETRPRPHLDDKIITGWNGLYISAFSRAHQVLDDEKYLKPAERVNGN